MKRRMINLSSSLLFALAGCSATEPSGPAVILPHTVAMIGPFQFVLERDQEHWHVSATCGDSAAKDATSMLVRIASATGASSALIRSSMVIYRALRTRFA